MADTNNIRQEPDFQYPISIIDVFRDYPGVLGPNQDQIIQRLYERDLALENAMWRPEISFGDARVLTVDDETPLWLPAHGGHLTTVVGVLKNAPVSSPAQITVQKFNVETGGITTLGTLDWGVGVYKAVLYLDEPFVIGIHAIGLVVTAADGDAGIPSVSYRFNEDGRSI